MSDTLGSTSGLKRERDASDISLGEEAKRVKTATAPSDDGFCLDDEMPPLTGGPEGSTLLTSAPVSVAQPEIAVPVPGPVPVVAAPQPARYFPYKLITPEVLDGCMRFELPSGNKGNGKCMQFIIKFDRKAFFMFWRSKVPDVDKMVQLVEDILVMRNPWMIAPFGYSPKEQLDRDKRPTGSISNNLRVYFDEPRNYEESEEDKKERAEYAAFLQMMDEWTIDMLCKPAVNYFRDTKKWSEPDRTMPMYQKLGIKVDVEAALKSVQDPLLKEQMRSTMIRGLLQQRYAKLYKLPTDTVSEDGGGGGGSAPASDKREYEPTPYTQFKFGTYKGKYDPTGKTLIDPPDQWRARSAVYDEAKNLINESRELFRWNDTNYTPDPEKGLTHDKVTVIGKHDLCKIDHRFWSFFKLTAENGVFGWSRYINAVQVKPTWIKREEEDEECPF